jgi:cytochrome c oxidase subunit 3
MMKRESNQIILMQNSIAMTVTLISFGMMFATMFLGYCLVRFNTPIWPPVEIQGMPKLLPLISTLVMGLSSYTYYLMERSEKKIRFWFLTTALGLLFLALQSTLWSTLQETGIVVANGMVPSMVYAFTWIHAAHILLALLGLFWIGYLLLIKSPRLTMIKIMNVGKFWHFLGIIWLLMYLTLFVL